jgi:hypothetical protein
VQWHDLGFAFSVAHPVQGLRGVPRRNGIFLRAKNLADKRPIV